MTASTVLPAAVVVLAHKRLGDVVEVLERKVAGGHANVGFVAGARRVPVADAERRVLALARAAREQLGAGERVDLPADRALGPGPSRLAILGSAAHSLPVYASLLTGGGGAVAAAVRTGSASPATSFAAVDSTKLALRVGELGIGAGATAPAARAFAHGILGAVATGVVVDPVLRGLHARRTTADWTPLDPQAERGAAERRALRELLGPGGADRWLGFWPVSQTVTDPLLQAYATAVGELLLATHPGPAGVAPAPPSSADLRAGVELVRLDAALATWSPWGWWGFLLPLWAVPSISLLVARSLPAAGAFFGGPGDVGDAAVTELLSLAAGVASLTPFVWSMLLWSQVPSRSDVFVEALVLFLLRLGITVGWGATTGGRPETGLRWGLLGPLLGTDVYALVRGLVDVAAGRPFDGFVRLLQVIPAATGLATLGIAGLARLIGVSDDPGFWAYWAAVTGGLLLAGIPTALAMAGRGIPGMLPRAAGAVPTGGADPGAPALAAGDDPAAPALAFDDSTLWLAGGGDTPTTEHLRYPVGTQPLVKVWWEGSGDLELSTGAHLVTLHLTGGDTVVSVPFVDRTPAALAAALAGALPGVRTEVVDPMPVRPLPWPVTLLTEGRAAVGTTASRARVLRGAPRASLATPVGLAGGPVTPVPLVPTGALADVEQTALGVAADLSVLLHLGAAPWLASVSVTTPGTGGAPSTVASLARPYEVFRRWNLDERRINEWRMVVSGGATSEKGGRPAETDAGMLQGRPSSNPAPDGADVADAMGWVPLWRAWLRVAGDLTADVGAATTMPYSPDVRRSDGTTFRPTNAQLTAGVRYLLELP